MKLYENNQHLCDGALNTNFNNLELRLFDIVYIDTTAEHHLEDESGKKRRIFITGIYFGPTFSGMRVTIHFVYRN